MVLRNHDVEEKADTNSNKLFFLGVLCAEVLTDVNNFVVFADDGPITAEHFLPSYHETWDTNVLHRGLVRLIRPTVIDIEVLIGRVVTKRREELYGRVAIGYTRWIVERHRNHRL